jgi:uncharacterized membrane protein YukC
MIYVYIGLTIWLIAISAMIYYAFLLPNAIEHQERFVAELATAYDNHPFPDYALRLSKEERRLERMRRRMWRVE